MFVYIPNCFHYSKVVDVLELELELLVEEVELDDELDDVLDVEVLELELDVVEVDVDVPPTADLQVVPS